MILKSITRKLALLILFTSVWHTPVFAQLAPQGYLVIEKGSVKISRGKRDHYFSQSGEKVPVYKFDRIQTALGTKVKIYLTTNKDIVELYSKTFFKIGPITKVSSAVSMPIGKARLKVRKHRRSNRRFRLRTANAVIGVKGTEFVVGTNGIETNVLTLEGTVGLANIKTPAIEINIKINEVSRTGQDTNPTRPVTVTPEQRKEILTKDSGNSFNNVKFGKVLVVKKQKKRATTKKKTEKEKRKVEKKAEPTKKDETKNSKKPDSTKGPVPTPGAAPSGGGAGSEGASISTDNPEDSSLEVFVLVPPEEPEIEIPEDIEDINVDDVIPDSIDDEIKEIIIKITH